MKSRFKDLTADDYDQQPLTVEESETILRGCIVSAIIIVAICFVFVGYIIFK